MGLFKDILNLFKNGNLNGNKECVGAPIQHYSLERSSEDYRKMWDWEQGPCKETLLNYIKNNYEIWNYKPCEQCECIDFYGNDSFRGFVIHFLDLPYECQDVIHLFDYLKINVCNKGYNVTNADVRIFEKPRWLEKSERYILHSNSTTNPFNDVNMELRYRDDEVIQLKFIAFKQKNYDKKELPAFFESFLH